MWTPEYTPDTTCSSSRLKPDFEHPAREKGETMETCFDTNIKLKDTKGSLELNKLSEFKTFQEQ